MRKCKAEIDLNFIENCDLQLETIYLHLQP